MVSLTESEERAEQIKRHGHLVLGMTRSLKSEWVIGRKRWYEYAVRVRAQVCRLRISADGFALYLGSTLINRITESDI